MTSRSQPALTKDLRGPAVTATAQRASPSSTAGYWARSTVRNKRSHGCRMSQAASGRTLRRVHRKGCRRMDPEQISVVLKRFESPDETRILKKGKFEVVRIGGMTIGRATYEPGWRWS